MALYTTTGFTNGDQKSLQVKGKKNIYHQSSIKSGWSLKYTFDHLSKRMTPKILVDQLTLSQPGRAHHAPYNLPLPPQIFRHSGIPAFTYDAIEKTKLHLSFASCHFAKLQGLRSPGFGGGAQTLVKHSPHSNQGQGGR